MKLQHVVEALDSTLGSRSKGRIGPAKPRYSIPRSDWQEVVRRVVQGKTLRHLASSYSTSYVTVRCILRTARSFMPELVQ